MNIPLELIQLFFSAMMVGFSGALVPGPMFTLMAVSYTHLDRQQSMVWKSFILKSGKIQEKTERQSKGRREKDFLCSSIQGRKIACNVSPIIWKLSGKPGSEIRWTPWVCQRRHKWCMCARQCKSSVSYTHLDVYKRQGVRMLSFYECKNFEFEAVFIPFLNKGYLPSLISKPQIYENDFLTFLVEGRFFNEEEIKHIHLENERRILYSGLSRCKNYLYITSGWGHLSSPFFTELADVYKRQLQCTQ